MIQYYETDEKELDLIEGLWEELKHHHKLRSKYFFQDYENIVFEDRKKELLKKAEKGMVRVDLAESSSGNSIAYCVSSILNEKGEIDSIFVKDDYRSMGVGNKLMKRALTWFDIIGVENREIQLSVGNDDVLKFYSQYGFHPKHVILKQKK